MSDKAGSHALGGIVVHLLIAPTDLTFVKTVGAKETATAIFLNKEGKANFATPVVVKTVGADKTPKAGGV